MGPFARRISRLTRIARIARIARITCIATSAWIILTPPAPARAEDPAPSDSSGTEAPSPRYRLDPTVVTAERLPVLLSKIPSDVVVIGRARLMLDQPFLIADALREVPGLDAQRSGNLGKLTDVRLRGADPRHTLVLFDGIPLNGPWLGSFDFADVGGAGFGQVEVMGGPASSLYGSGAVGGVIQFVSPSGPVAADERLRAFAEYGEQETFRQSVEWRAAAGKGSVGAQASRLSTSGEGSRDAYAGVSGRLNADVPVGRDRLRLSGLFTRGKKEIPYDFRFDFSDFEFHEVVDPNQEETDRVGAGSVSYSHAVGRGLSLEGEVSGLSGRIEFDNGADAGTSDFVHTDLDNTRGIASLRARVVRGPAQAIFGAEYRGEQVDRHDESEFGGFGSVTDVDRGVNARALYAQAHVEPGDRVLLDAGIRLDDHSKYGATGMPRLALGIVAREVGVKLRGGYGRAFTAPTLTDLYYPGYGSETLRPERSRTWEAGADGAWLDGRLEARATWHTTRFTDLIQSNSFFVADNVGSARIEGEEYSLRATPHPRLAIRCRAAHLVANRLGAPQGSDNRLAKRPKWRAGVAADLVLARGVTTTAALRWVDSMVDPFNFYDVEGRYLSGDTPGYASLDLGAVVSLATWVPAELRVRIGNALDRSYSEVKGFPARGRAFTVGVTFVK